MSLTLKQVEKEALALPTASREKLVRRLLGSINGAPLSAREKAILDERLDDDEKTPGEGLTWAQVKKSLRQARR